MVMTMLNQMMPCLIKKSVKFNLILSSEGVCPVATSSYYYFVKSDSLHRSASCKKYRKDTTPRSIQYVVQRVKDLDQIYDSPGVSPLITMMTIPFPVMPCLRRRSNSLRSRSEKESSSMFIRH